MTRRLLPYLLLLLLLAGQQLAVTHAYWHAGKAVATADGSSSHHKNKGGLQSNLCDLHALLHDLCDTPQPFVPSLPVSAAATDPLALPAYVPRTARTPLPPSRGPPVIPSV